jgi:phytoene dehydrogenase-like protein
LAAFPQSKATVIGSGPNGLAAAILLARAGRKVTVYEASQQIGGGMRSAELTLPGFLHDVCAAVYPMGISSPCFEMFPLAKHGLEWVVPPAVVAHPLDDGAVVMERSLEATAANLGEDGAAWKRLMGPFAEAWPRLRHDAMAPWSVPRHPLLMARLGMVGIRTARSLAEGCFRGARARALFAGMAAHSVMPLENAFSSSSAVVLGALGHAYGWPIVRGGAQRLGDALASYLRSLGGEIVADHRVDALPEGLVMCDIAPRQLLALAGDRLPAGYRRSLERFRHGPGVFKVDWALDAPIPWRSAECARAATVHLGGTFDEVARWESGFTGRPFVLLVQPTLFDTSRAPAGKHTAWAYCHVPNGSAADMTEAIEDQVERFAPGFRARILGRHTMGPAELEKYNANLVGGDIGGGAMSLRQFFLRPNRWRYRTPIEGVFLCSSSTPPGGAVHGMCGYHAARTAIKRG